MRPVQLVFLICGWQALLALSGCTQHRVDVQPIRVEPIHLTIDVNVKIDRELDEFFDYKQPPEPLTPPVNNDADSTQPPAVDPHAPVETPQPSPAAESIPSTPSGVNP